MMLIPFDFIAVSKLVPSPWNAGLSTDQLEIRMDYSVPISEVFIGFLPSLVDCML